MALSTGGTMRSRHGTVTRDTHRSTQTSRGRDGHMTPRAEGLAHVRLARPTRTVAALRPSNANCRPADPSETRRRGRGPITLSGSLMSRNLASLDSQRLHRRRRLWIGNDS